MLEIVKANLIRSQEFDARRSRNASLQRGWAREMLKLHSCCRCRSFNENLMRWRERVCVKVHRKNSGGDVHTKAKQWKHAFLWASDLFSCCVYSVVFMRCRRRTHNGVPWIIVKIKAANNGRGNLWRKREIDIVQVRQSSYRTDFNYTSRRPLVGGPPRLLQVARN